MLLRLAFTWVGGFTLGPHGCRVSTCYLTGPSPQLPQLPEAVLPGPVEILFLQNSNMYTFSAIGKYPFLY